MDSDKIISLETYVDIRLEKLNRGEIKVIAKHYSFCWWSGFGYEIITVQRNKKGVWTR